MKPCKIWTGCKNQDGYGMRTTKVAGKWRARGVHRLACIEAHGPPPPGKPEAMHSCDNRACYEPSHLRWGSRLDNMRDAAQKGRMSHGEENNRAKLTSEDVREIRLARGKTCLRELSLRYGVSAQQVSRIQLNYQRRAG
jgi:hypothetical protein